jgi:hypothetical protein
VQWSKRCWVPPGSRAIATVPGAEQQLREARRRALGTEEWGAGRDIELQVWMSGALVTATVVLW